jgi:hypothetical protein
MATVTENTMPESEDQVRNLKASESVQAAFQGQGYPAPPPGIADIIAAHVKSETRGVGLRDLKNMTPGSGQLGSAASSGVNIFLSMLTGPQRDAAKAGLNPFDQSAVQRFEFALRGGLLGNAAVNGSRFAEMKETGVRSGVAAGMIDDYAKQYAGSGLDKNAVGTLASVALGVGDFRALEKLWGRDAVLRGAETAGEFGFKGRDAVGDVTGISNGERDLWKDYHKAKTPEERKAIEARINALPPRKGEDQDKAEKRRKKIQKRFDDLNAKTPTMRTATEQASVSTAEKAEQVAIFEAMKRKRSAQPKQPG